MTRRLAVLVGAWLAGLPLIAGAFWLVIESEHIEDKAATAAVALTAGFSFITTGLIAIWRRPENRTGLLLAATGYAWLLGALTAANDRWLFTIGFLVGSVVWGPFAHLILAYPTGRLQTHFQRLLVGATYALVLGEAAALVLVGGTREVCGAECPEGRLALTHSETAADTIGAAGTLAAAVIVATALTVLTRRWRAATPALRRALGGVLLTAGATLVLLILVPLADILSERLADAFEIAALTAFGTVPIAFLLGVLRARLARSAAGNLLLELGQGAHLRDALARALHDPSLEIGYWVEDQERYVDADGRRLRTDGERPTRLVEREGRPIAALRHDPMLADEPELVDAVAAAAGLWLENERLQVEARAQYRFLETVVNTAPSLLVSVGPDGRIRNFNTAVERASGLDDPEQIRGRFFWEVFIDPDERHEMLARFEAAAPEFPPSEYENTFTNVRGERTVIAWSTAPLVDEEGVTQSVIAGGIDITERKRQELELQAGEERLRATIEASPVAIVEIDFDDRVLSWNPAAERMFGWTAAEVVGQVIPTVPPSDGEGAASLNDRVQAGEVISGYETTRLRKDGTTVDVEISAAPLRDSSGEVIAGMALYVDVTDRKLRELDLQASEERMRAIIEASPVAIVEFDPDDLITTWNPAAERMYGWKAEEVIGGPVPFIPPDREGELRMLIARVRAGQVYTGYETVRRRKDGSPVEVAVSAAPVRDATGTVVGRIALFADITDRKQREHDLQASEARLRATIEASPVAIVEIDLDGRAATWNPAAERMFGWAADEVIGGPVPFVPRDRELELRELVTLVEAGEAFTGFETVRRRKNGSTVDVAISGAPIRNSSGAVVGRIAVFADITERKLRELELQRERDFLRTVADATPSLLVVVDEDATIVGNAVNKAFERSIGWSEDEILGRSFLEIFHPEDGYFARLGVASAFNGAKPQEYLARWRTRDGGELAIAWTATPFVDMNGRQLVLVCGVDITERQSQEEEIRASRARIVEAGDAARRQLERNLHDGAQQRLISLSLSLRLAQGKLDDPAAAERILTAAREELSLALEELRELARGIHPAVLTDRGLGAALEAVAARATLPIDLVIPDGRLPGSIEAAAYYIVAEALTNVAKYAGASRAVVRVAEDSDGVVVEVVDDGVGGADPTLGTGLRGLADRIAALDGTLSVESPAGGGTCIRAHIPVRQPALQR